MAIVEYGHADDYVTVHDDSVLLASLIVDGFYGLKDIIRDEFIEKLEMHFERRYYPQFLNEFDDKEKMKVLSLYDRD